MASLGSDFRTDLAALIFAAVPIANVADDAASSPITSIEVALHTADPTSGNQTTSEAGYTSYARVAVARETSSYTGSGGLVSNDAAITFPTSTGGSSTCSHVSLGTAHTSTGKIIVAGALTSSVSVTTGVTPRFQVTALSITIS